MQSILQKQKEDINKLSDQKTIPVDLAESIIAKVGAPLTGTKAALIWSKSSNFVRLSKVDDEENETDRIFEVAPNVIEKADFTFNLITITVNGQTYTLYIRSIAGDTVHLAGIFYGGGGAPAVALGTVVGIRKGVDDLRQLLNSQGVKTTKPRVLKMILGTTAVMITLLLLAIAALRFYPE